MKGIVYQTTNLVNGKIYIGQHECSTDEFDGYLGGGRNLQYAIKKYGKENFKRETLRVCEDNHEMSVWEHYYIKLKKAQDPDIGYNIADGDVNTSQYNPAKRPEVREKISKVMRNFRHTEETKKRLSESHKGKKPGNAGKPCPENVKIKISNQLKGKYAGVKNPMYGKHHSEETKKRWSEMRKGKPNRTNFTPELRKQLSDKAKEDFKSGKRKAYWQGKKRPEDFCKKISKVKKGIGLGNKWINNGIEEKLISPEIQLPEGWNYGRIKREENGKKLIGCKWITNGIEDKQIQSNELLPDGWYFGRTKLKRSDTKAINNGKVNKWLKSGEPMPEGFVYGFMSRKKKGA